MTEKMLGALGLLKEEDLTWEKDGETYLWMPKDRTKPSIFMRTIKALEQRGYVKIFPGDKENNVSDIARITQKGLSILESLHWKKTEEEKMKEQEKQEGPKMPEEKAERTENTEGKEGKGELPRAGWTGQEAVQLVREMYRQEQMREAYEMEEYESWRKAQPAFDCMKQEELDRECTGNAKPAALKKQTVILVDSENAGNTWLDLMDKLKANDELHIFFTDKSPTLTYQTVVDLMKHENISKLKWIKCCMGNNALDFQLATELGSMIAEKRIREEFDPDFIILSKDTGYDPVVYYWSCRDVRIRRFPNVSDVENKMQNLEAEKVKDTKNTVISELAVVEMKEEEQPVPEQKEPPVSKKKEPLSMEAMQMIRDPKNVLRGKSAIGAMNEIMKEKTWREKLVDFLAYQTTLKDPQAAAEYLIEMSKLVSVTSEGKYLYAVIAQFGGANGKVIMDEIKRNKFLRINLSNGLIKNVRTRKKNYIMLFLRSNGFLDPDIRSISPLLSNPANAQRETMERLLLRNHDGAETAKLINIIETHMRVIREIR